MKTTKLFNPFLIFTFLALLAFTQIANATANLQGLNSRYLIWHRFDEIPPVDSTAFEVTNSGEYVFLEYPFVNGALSLSNTEFATFQYDVSSLDSEGWYILQIGGDYKVEMSADNATWTTVLEASEVANWTNKVKCTSPYYIDIQSFLSEDTLYVKISDNNLSPSDNSVLESFIETLDMGVSNALSVKCGNCGGSAQTGVTFQRDFFIPKYKFK